MENTYDDSVHIVTALAAAGIKARSEMTGGHVYVTYVDVSDDKMIGITNESYADDAWLAVLYDPRDFEDEGITLGEEIGSTPALVELVRAYLLGYLREELELAKLV